MTPRFDTPDPIAVDLEVGMGDVRIEASDRVDTTVQIRPSDPAKPTDVRAAEQTRVEYANGHLIVKGPSSWRRWVSHRGDSIDVAISLPAGSSLHARDRRGDPALDRPLGSSAASRSASATSLSKRSVP